MNTAVAIGVGLGIARKHCNFITGSDEDFSLTKDLAKSLLHQMGLVKRRVSTKSKVNVCNNTYVSVVNSAIHFRLMLKTSMI